MIKKKIIVDWHPRDTKSDGEPRQKWNVEMIKIFEATWKLEKKAT